MTDIVDPEGNETRAIHELVNFSAKDVLEIGCGDGRLMWRYADYVATSLGIDSVEGDIERAHASTPDHLRTKVSFQALDAVSAEFAPASFDVVVLGRSI